MALLVRRDTRSSGKPPDGRRPRKRSAPAWLPVRLGGQHPARRGGVLTPLRSASSFSCMDPGRELSEADHRDLGPNTASARLPRRRLCPNAAIAVPLACSVMSAKRMSREDFFAKLAPWDEDRLRKVLWNLYW